MSRKVHDLTKSGIVINGFDYSLGVSVSNGVIEDCTHPADMQRNFCCNSHRLAGHKITEIRGHERRYGEKI